MTRKKKSTAPLFLRRAVRYVEKWVPRLRIQDFEIEVVAASEDFDNYARATVNVPHLRASIEVRDPADAPEDAILACNDLEVTIVHELLHVRFGEVLVELDGKAHYANEVATEMIALALVAADRGVDPRSL